MNPRSPHNWPEDRLLSQSWPSRPGAARAHRIRPLVSLLLLEKTIGCVVWWAEFVVEKLHCGQANNGARVGKPPWRFLRHYPAVGHSPETSAHLLPRRRAAAWTTDPSGRSYAQKLVTT
jgi:hypothetical protein